MQLNFKKLKFLRGFPLTAAGICIVRSRVTRADDDNTESCCANTLANFQICDTSPLRAAKKGCVTAPGNVAENRMAGSALLERAP